MALHHREEKTRIANGLGYAGYYEAICGLYRRGMSQQEVAEVFDVHKRSIAKGLKRCGVQARSRGGNNNPFGANQWQ